MRAMVMAAGAGTRLHPLTYAVPKPMIPVANRPVLEYTLENLRRHGITELVLNLHSHPEMMRRHFKNGEGWGVRIHYSHEPKLMGTAGGVKKVESFLKQGPFLIMSGDGLTDIDLTQLIKFHREHKAVGTMALSAIDSRFEYGVTLTNAQGRIQKFIEKPEWKDIFSNHVNTGIYVFEPAILRQIPKGKSYDFGHQLWPKLLTEKAPIFGKLVSNYWCDIGNLQEYRRAQKDVLDGKIRIAYAGRQMKPKVWIEEGVRMAANVKIEGPVLIGKNCRIEAGAKIGPYCIIGQNAQIGKRVTLRHTTLWNDVRIGPAVNLENCIVTHGVQITQKLHFHDGNFLKFSGS